MQCPHCLVAFNEKWCSFSLLDENSAGRGWSVRHQYCPECERLIAILERKEHSGPVAIGDSEVAETVNAYPKFTQRPPAPESVPSIYANDYREACLVLPDSPKASAALSRRCLQAIIRDEYHIDKRSLAEQIDDLIASKQLPPYLSDAIDAVRNVGNFAAHPLKDTNTGEIVEVEAGEAEWLLDILERLFEFSFVEPAKLKAKRDALNKKLADAGKPPMK